MMMMMMMRGKYQMIYHYGLIWYFSIVFVLWYCNFEKLYCTTENIHRREQISVLSIQPGLFAYLVL